MNNRSYGINETITEKLDRVVGMDAPIWYTIDQRIIPALLKVALGMLVLLGAAAAIHGNVAFAAVMVGLIILGLRLRSEGLNG